MCVRHVIVYVCQTCCLRVSDVVFMCVRRVVYVCQTCCLLFTCVRRVFMCVRRGYRITRRYSPRHVTSVVDCSWTTCRRRGATSHWKHITSSAGLDLDVSSCLCIPRSRITSLCVSVPVREAWLMLLVSDHDLPS